MITSQPAAPARTATSRGARWLVVAIVLLGALLRLPGAVNFALWEDELYSAGDAARLLEHPAADPRPLYFALHYLAMLILPDTPLGLRLLAFGFGVAGIWLTWLIGARLFGATAGAVAALLLAIAPWHIYASQIARYVTLVYLLAALSFYAIDRAHETGTLRAYALALLASLGGLLTHPIFLFPLAGVALACMLVTTDGRIGWQRPTRSAWLYLWIPFAVVVALIGALHTAYGTVDQVTERSAHSLAGLIRFLPGIVQALTPTVSAAGVAGAAALLVLPPRWGPAPRRWGMMTLLGGATTCLFLVGASRSLAFGTMHAAPMYPLLMVSAGALIQIGADHISLPRRAFIAAAVLILFAGVLPSTVSHLSDGTRFDYRPVFRQIEARGPELPVVTWPIVQQRHYAPGLRGIPLPENGTTAVLDSMLAAGAPFWVVASFRRYGLVYDDLGNRTRWLFDHCRLTTRHERPRLDYQIFRVELYRCDRAP